MSKTKDEVFAELEGLFSQGGMCEGRDISGTKELVFLLTRRYLLRQIGDTEVPDALMGALLMGGLSEGDARYLPDHLAHLRYAYQWDRYKSDWLATPLGAATGGDRE